MVVAGGAGWAWRRGRAGAAPGAATPAPVAPGAGGPTRRALALAGAGAAVAAAALAAFTDAPWPVVWVLWIVAAGAGVLVAGGNAGRAAPRSRPRLTPP